MSKKINTTGALVVGAVMGAALAIGAYSFLGQPTGISSDKASAGGEKKPLHWVAPMDPNYKRDKPGKSPMGMDLIPVYADEGGGPDAGPGTIKIWFIFTQEWRVGSKSFISRLQVTQ